MKSYIVTVEMNRCKDLQKLDEKNRELHEVSFQNCYHLADLFNCLHAFMKSWDGFFPEVIGIREI